MRMFDWLIDWLILAVLGLRFCARAFPSCGKRGPLFIAMRGPLTAAASLVAEHRLQTRRLSSCGSRAQPLRGMWDPPRPGLEPVSPAPAGRLSTTAPPGKPSCVILRMEIIPPPTQISITYHPGHIYCPLTVLLQALSSSQALLRPHSNHILHCLSLGDPGTGVSPSPVKWSWPNLTFIKSFRRPWPPTQNKRSVSKDYVKFYLFSFPWPLLTTRSHRDLCGYGRPPGIQQW